MSAFLRTPRGIKWVSTRASNRGTAGDKFNPEGELTDEPTQKLIAGLWGEFRDWIGRVKG